MTSVAPATSPAPAWKDAFSSWHRDANANLAILTTHESSKLLIEAHVAHLVDSTETSDKASSTTPGLDSLSTAEKVRVGLAALDVFLQANVTGPVVLANRLGPLQALFSRAWNTASSTEGIQPDVLTRLRKASLAQLEIDGVSPYGGIPHLELFSFARFIFLSNLHSGSSRPVEVPSNETKIEKYSIPWIRLRIRIWHYKLLTQPSLGPGSNFTKSSQWSEVPSLVTSILEEMKTVRTQIAGDEVWAEAHDWSRDDQAYFLVEAANYYILLGRHEQAKESLKEAARVTGLTHALSGALGKRTRFQENTTSQLVVLARSRVGETAAESLQAPETESAKPDALRLNDDTLFEEIQFTRQQAEGEVHETVLPPGLAELSPDDQPQLAPLDQIILLTEATIKDAFSPVDALTSEEVLPYAVRVLADGSTNWQIYTQALLVRSRIEIHRSRTMERGILQLQAVADQVLTDTTVQPEMEAGARPASEEPAAEVPAIEISAPDQDKTATSNSRMPTSFLPAPKATESAPAHVRLRYIDALSTPPRWHLEAELAYAWAGVGSMTSALEIFKRLSMWAEVALCYASAAASSEDEDGRAAGGEEKAKAVLRWRLFHASGQDASSTSDPDDQDVEEVIRLKASGFQGPERSPPPPNAARLWCILGDMENDASHYERAWTVSRRRYARAQKSLGEHYLARKEAKKAREAYVLATSVNRLSPELWGRLGDINLGLGNFDEAAEAYNRSIGCATDTAGGEDARTWSNMGSALWSLYCEAVATSQPDTPAPSASNQAVTDQAHEQQQQQQQHGAASATDEAHEQQHSASSATDKTHGQHPATYHPQDPATLLTRSLAAYKRGASIAHDNWRIWDNVLTLASRLRPPSIPDMVLALTHILRLRPTEAAIDADALTALLRSALSQPPDPARGSPARLITLLIEDQVVPLITHRADLWGIVARLRTWRGDHERALDACERAWRAALADAPWSTTESWDDVVSRTGDLVGMLETWGADLPAVGTKWRGRARSALRTVMGRGKEAWEGSEGWKVLQSLMEGVNGA